MPESRPIRLVDAGTVPALRSQSIYHGLAHARTTVTPDTVVLATPESPYVCIGFHQDLEAEVDQEWCASRGLPVFRRETGGGVVYLDSDQHFVQWIMGPESLPARVEKRFELFARPLVETYRSFGIEAAFRPANDVQVEDRKIVGTGAARIGEAEVLVGNVMVSFDTEIMAQVLRVPSEAFREQIRRSLDRYVTSIRGESGVTPERTAIAAAYVWACAEALGRRLEPGVLTSVEKEAIRESERVLLSEAFRSRPGGRARRGVKIHEDVYVVETVGRPGTAPEGVRITARLRSGRIEEVALAGGRPGRETELQELADGLPGVLLGLAPVATAVGSCLPEAVVAEWVEAIMALDIS